MLINAESLLVYGMSLSDFTIYRHGPLHLNLLRSRQTLILTLVLDAYPRAGPRLHDAPRYIGYIGHMFIAELVSFMWSISVV